MADGSERGAIALLVLCGLPGAGKTTLCRKLRDYLCTKNMVHVLHICYDELVPSDLNTREGSVTNSLQCSTSRSSISEGISDFCSWKSYRCLVIDSVEKLVSFNKHNEKKDQHFDKETSDYKLLEFWPMFLKNIAGTEKNCECISGSAIRWDTAVHHVIAIDDNMFYRSMRYQYFQLARRYGLGFAEIFLECSTNIALTRNGQRSMQVSQNTIEAMATKIEIPEPGKFPWEQNSLKVDAGSSLGTASLESIENLVMHAILNPVPPLVEDDLEEKEASRAVCLDNMLHQADHALRKHIGQVMTAAKASGKPKSELSSLGNQLNRKRKMLLEEIQNTRQADVEEMQSDRQEKRDEGIEDAAAEHFWNNTTVRKTMFKTLTDAQDRQQMELMIKDIFEHYSTP